MGKNIQVIYTVQNAYGEVYGKYPLDASIGLSSQEWADRLQDELAGILGINGVHAMRLVLDSRTNIGVDRVVVDVNPGIEDAVDRVHFAVGFIALTTPPANY